MTLLSNLPKIRGQYRENYILAPFTWFKVGGAADVFFKPADVEDLCNFLANKPSSIPATVIGACSNIIIRDGGIEGVVIRLGGACFSDITLLADNKIRIGAGALNYHIAQFCLQNNIKGFEFLVGIPGTVGGGVAMNAGAYGKEYKDIVSDIEAVDLSGNLHYINNSDAGFKYRANSLSNDLIFTAITCNYELGDEKEIKILMDEIMAKRSSSQPVKEKTGGSTFANPEENSAWKLIDEVGMRGARLGGAMISDKHCNFMINFDNATAADLENLGERVKMRVKECFGIELKWEIKRLGKPPLTN